MAELESLGAAPRAEAGLVLFEVEPVDGVLAGEAVVVGVEGAELTRWPALPPHWLHLPSSIKFAQTNTQPSPRAGWLRHSRQIMGWGVGVKPGAAWLAHVRGVLGLAVG